MNNHPILYMCGMTANIEMNTGIQRVTRSLARGLQESSKILVPIGYDLDTRELYVLNDNDLERLSRFNGPFSNKWENKKTIEHYLSLDTVIIIPELFNRYIGQNKDVIDKLGNIKKYFIFHDAIPAVLKNIYSEQDQNNHIDYINSLSYADGIAAVSKHSMNDFIKIINNDNYNIKDIHLPNKFYFDTKIINEKQNNTKEIEILTVASLDERKNHRLLIGAFAMAQRELNQIGYNLRLNLVGHVSGGNNSLKDFIVNATTNNQIKFYEDASDDVLENLYANADFTIYPSTYEGYGIPVVESLHFNTPCIASNSTSIKEIASDGGCLLFDPYSAKDLADKIIYIVKEKGVRQKLLEEIQHLKWRSWNDYANDILDFIYKK